MASGRPSRKASCTIDQALALYDPAEHRPLATRFGQDIRGGQSCPIGPGPCWLLGYPEAALADTRPRARGCARDRSSRDVDVCAVATRRGRISHCGNYATANAVADELVTLAGEKGAVFWEAFGMMVRGCLFALTGKASDAIQIISSAIAFRATGATVLVPSNLSYLARAYAEFGNSMMLGAALATR